MSKGSNSSGGGCALLIVGVLVLGAVLWGVAIVLNVLGFLLLLGGPLIGLLFIIHGWNGVRRQKKVQRQVDELQEIAADARRDLNDVQLELDYLAMTKGIGADLDESDRAELARLRTEVASAKGLLDAAPTAKNLHEALMQAEEVRLRARRLTP